MYYKLIKPWSLRGYPGEPLTLDCAGVPGPQHRLNGALFRILLQCDGVTEVTIPDEITARVLEKYTERGVIEPCAEPSPIREWQTYHYYDHRRIPGAFFSLTGRCNLHCRHCFAQAENLKSAREFTMDQIVYILSQLQAEGIQSLILSGGEPLMHRQFPEILDEIAARDMSVYRLYTNGLLLTEEIAERLKKHGMTPEMVISFDGLGVHDWMRRREGAQDRVTEAMALCRKYGFPIRCAVNVNERSLPVMEETARFLYAQGARSLFLIRTSESPEWLRTGERCLTAAEYWEAALSLIRGLRDLNRQGLTLQFFNGPLVPPGADREFYRQLEAADTEELKECMAWCRKARDWLSISSTGLILPCDAYEGAALESGFFREKCNILERPLGDILKDSDYARTMEIRVKDIMEANPECRDCKWLRRCHGADCRVGGTLGQAAKAGEGYFRREGAIRPVLKGPLSCAFYRGGYFDRMLEILEEKA